MCYVFSAEGKPVSKKAAKKQQKEAEKAKKKAETAAKLVSCCASLILLILANLLAQSCMVMLYQGIWACTRLYGHVLGYVVLYQGVWTCVLEPVKGVEDLRLFDIEHPHMCKHLNSNVSPKV